MSKKHPTPRLQPGLIQYEQFRNNGQLPADSWYRRIAKGFNHAALYKPKTFITKFNLNGGLVFVDSGALWFARGITGPATHNVRAYVGLAKNVSPGSDPRVRILWTNETDGASEVDDTIRYSAETSDPAVTPGEVHHAFADLPVLPLKAYTFVLRVEDKARPLYWSLVEYDKPSHVLDTDAGVADPSPYVTEGPIYGQSIANLIAANNEQILYGGAHLLGWTASSISFAPTTTSGSFVDAFGGTPGSFRLPIEHRGTLMRGVPVTFSVQVDAAEAEVRLFDATDSVELVKVAHDGIVSPFGVTAEATLDPDIHDHDIRLQFRRTSGASPARLVAASLSQGHESALP